MDACPRLRPLEIFPTEIDGQTVLCLRDPSGLTEHLAFVPPPAMAILALCDGVRTPAEVASEFQRRTGARLGEAQLLRLLEQLDEGLFLETPRFEAHYRVIVEEFRAAPRRAASHAGASYPVDAAKLRALLDGHLRAARPAAPATVALIAPHIDFPRGGPVYGQAYAALGDAGGPPPDLVVIFGTDHNGVRGPFTLTRKSYETPLGTLETDVALVDALAAECGDELFAEELHHRREHSIEFQAVWLRHVYADRPPLALPVLCGPLVLARGVAPLDHPPVRRFLEALRRHTAGRRVLVVAGADLAHVGPRFGDGPFGEAECAQVEAADRAALAAAERVDAAGFWDAIVRDDDRFRVCGLSPIVAALTAVAGRATIGETLGYAQCPADERSTSWVSIAALAIR